MHSRRRFLAGAAALGVNLAVTRSQSAAQAPASRRIDVHSHLAPPAYVAELGSQRLGSRVVQDWSPAKAVEDMDRAGVTTSITSITNPGVWFGDATASRHLARECNDYAARLASDRPGRFGVFAALPLPDIEGSLQEIEYGLDTLKADGLAMFTNYGDKWLGDPYFAPLFEELNRRKAVVFTHPASANCCRNLVPGIPDNAIEFGTDTTRAIARIVFSGSAARYPEIRFIFSHAGGTMPFLMERFVLLAKGQQYAKQMPDGFLAAVSKYYYDTAQVSNAVAMAALRKVVPMSQIVFGTDFPFRTAAEHVQSLKECAVFSPQELQAIDHDNVARLISRYKI